MYEETGTGVEELTFGTMMKPKSSLYSVCRWVTEFGRFFFGGRRESGRVLS